MNPLDMAGQALGIGLGQSGQQVDFQQQDYYSQMYSNAITFSAPADTTLYIGNTATNTIEEKVEEPPDEFTQLSNHKFHELLDRFYELR